MPDDIAATVLYSVEVAIGEAVAAIFENYDGDDEAAAAALHDVVKRGRAFLAITKQALGIDQEAEIVNLVPPNQSILSKIRASRAILDTLLADPEATKLAIKTEIIERLIAKFPDEDKIIDQLKAEIDKIP